MKRTERVATKRRKNIAEMKIRKEKKLRKLDPPLVPLTATAIGSGTEPSLDLEVLSIEGKEASYAAEKFVNFTVSVRSKEEEEEEEKNLRECVRRILLNYFC